METNQFGTDEFIQWCRIVGTEPYIALNMGTGKMQYQNTAKQKAKLIFILGTLDEGEFLGSIAEPN